MNFKQKVKAYTPVWARQAYLSAKVRLARRRNLRLSTAEVFSETYAHNQWGGEPGGFCSGFGSSETFAVPYAGLMHDLIASFRGEPVRVLDLGCGDFRVAQCFVNDELSYLGVDIVPALIERNQREFSSNYIQFRCMDIIEDPLPDAEVCTIRQVFQHLSNDQIARVLRKLEKYPVLVITENFPGDHVHTVPNKDKPHGPDTRILNDSGVYLEKPPFNAKGLESLLRLPAGQRGVVETFVVDRRKSSPISFGLWAAQPASNYGREVRSVLGGSCPDR